MPARDATPTGDGAAPTRAPRLLDDLLGGTAAALVAFPSAIAFGLVVFASLGPERAGQGALYGMLGAVALGLVAGALGGRPGNVSAPCAPAAAVLAALTGALVDRDRGPELVLAVLSLAGLAVGALQLLVGILGGGRLIKFIPYPVVAGYLAAVGLSIVVSQVPKLLALPPHTELLPALTQPGLWRPAALTVGGLTIAATLLAPKLTARLPAPIVGLAVGGVAYAALCLVEPALRSVDNPLVIGRLGEGGSPLPSWAPRWRGLRALQLQDLETALIPATTLGLLLCVDALKTSVLVDSLTRTRHDSDRELRAQGVANLCAALLGGMPGSATAGPTLVNVSSGGRTRRSGIVAGAVALLTLVALSGLLAWVPQAALAGILIVIGLRMVDARTVDLARRRETAFDFCVVLTVVLTAFAVDLIVAAGVGVVLSILLFLRDQIGAHVVRRTLRGQTVSSKNRRLPEQRALLRAEGERIVIYQLQGNLFFGTADQLFHELEPQLTAGRIVILDLHRVGSLDFTAGRLLHQIAAQLGEAGGELVFANVDPCQTPYLEHFGVLGPGGCARAFADADDALGWAEDRLLEAAGLLDHPSAPPLALGELSLFQDLSPAQLEAVSEHVSARSFAPGERVFSCGEPGDSLFLVRRGSVRILLPLSGGATKHLATFGRASVFGDMAFLVPGPRSAHAEAETATDVYCLSRAAARALVASHPDVGSSIYARLGAALAERLRDADQELRLLAES
ncbi:MAG: SLC26A/SulP transporter family protein [Planctomycetota bacterium]